MFESFLPQGATDQSGYALSGEIDFDSDELEAYIKGIVFKIKFALEYLSLNILLKEFNESLTKFEPFNQQFEYNGFFDSFTSPILNYIRRIVDAITGQIAPEINEKLALEEGKILLERILMGTPKIIYDRKLEPKNEAEIRRAIYEHLIHVFPDTVREIPISKVAKVYKPDIGIKKLKIAIEYKFADSLQELKTSIGGIYEDIQGYEGSDDWTAFYAVIYQTDYFLTQFQIEAEFKLSKVNHTWKPILVYGNGKREPKKVKVVKKAKKLKK
jgi:hypothetical protein